MIREFWNRLEKKQRYYIAGAAIFVALALILEFGIFSLLDAKERIERSVQINQKKLSELVSLDHEFGKLQAKTAKVKRALAARTADYSLFSYVEKKAAQAGCQGNIKSMNSSRGAQAASYEESIVDIKLDKITIRQLTDFLYYAESATDLVRIKRISVSKMKGSPEYLTAQIQLASFQFSASHPAGR